MSRTFLLIGAGLVAGFVGYYAGLYAWLALTDLSAPGWAPVVTIGGAGLLGGLAIGLIARVPVRPALSIAIVGAGLGMGVGAALRMVNDSFELSVVSGLGLIVLLAVTARAMATRS